MLLKNRFIAVHIFDICDIYDKEKQTRREEKTMQPYENDQLRPEPEYIPPQEPEAVPQAAASQNPQEPLYRGAGVGRKESPFADSPYVMNHRPEQNNYAAPVPPTQTPVKPRKGRKVWKTVLAAVLTVALVVGSCGITASVVNSRWESRADQLAQEFNSKLDAMQSQLDEKIRVPITGTTINPATATGMTPGDVYAQNVQSVVLISCEITTSVYGQITTGNSSGSGFVLTENGYVVTNQHVVDGASKIYVSTYDGQKYPAQLIDGDATNDVAVLKIEAQNLDPVTIGSSEKLAVGDQVVAIGNPLGELTSTMTAGYVSAKNRDVTTDGRTINMIQTDAAINSGNSGGPLFNMLGEVVGITTAKYSGSSASGATIEGIGFAIPMDDVIGIIDDLVNYGYVTGAYLGVMVSDMDAEAAAYYGMPVGAYVQEVTPGYCAEAAGLHPKDIIVALGEHEVKNVSGLTRALRNFEAGQTTSVTVYRGGRELVLTITLDEKPRTTETIAPDQKPDTSEMPQDGSYEEWFNFFAPYFRNDKQD